MGSFPTWTYWDISQWHKVEATYSNVQAWCVQNKFVILNYYVYSTTKHRQDFPYLCYKMPIFINGIISLVIYHWVFFEKNSNYFQLSKTADYIWLATFTSTRLLVKTNHLKTFHSLSTIKGQRYNIINIVSSCLVESRWKVEMVYH